MIRKIGLFLALAIAAGCSAPRQYSTEGVQSAYGGRGRELQTLTNLHPDEVRGRLYSTNYQQNGLIPACSRVKIEELTDVDMHFTVVETGRQYHYVFHRSMREPLRRHLERYFGTCGSEHLSGLNEADQWGLRNGKVKPGMTRRGVILSIGYPPEHGTASLEMDMWRFWNNRLNTFLVEFQGDLLWRVSEGKPDQVAGAARPEGAPVTPEK